MSCSLFKVRCLQKYKSFKNAAPDDLKFLFLDGGSFCISHAEREDLLRVYVDSIKNGERVCMVEVKTEPYFVWFVDLDFKSDVSMDEIVRIATVMMDVVGDNGRCGISTCVRPWKTGVHVVFPDCVVTRDDALQLRQKCIARLEDSVSHIEDVFDATVYRCNTGLRALFSQKKNDASVYVPICTLDPQDGRAELDRNITLRAMQLFSVQTHSSRAPTGGGIRALLLASPARVKHVSPVTSNHKQRDTYRIAEVLSRVFSDEAPSTLVTGIRMMSPDVAVLRSKSHSCLNLVKGKHGNATIFFCVRKDRASNTVWVDQKCFCQCNDVANRAKGLCKNFRKNVLKFSLDSPSNADVVGEIFGVAQ